MLKGIGNDSRFCGSCIGGKKPQENNSQESLENQETIQNSSQLGLPASSSLASPEVGDQQHVQMSSNQMFKHDKREHKSDGNDKNYERVAYLKKQIEKLHLELNDMRRNIIPPERIQRFGELSERLSEIEGLLMELKLNCLHLKEKSNDSRRDVKEYHFEEEDGKSIFPSHPRRMELLNKKCLRIIEPQGNRREYYDGTFGEECEQQDTAALDIKKDCKERIVCDDYNNNSPSLSPVGCVQERYSPRAECRPIKNDNCNFNLPTHCKSFRRLSTSTHPEETRGLEKCRLAEGSQFETNLMRNHHRRSYQNADSSRHNRQQSVRSFLPPLPLKKQYYPNRNPPFTRDIQAPPQCLVSSEPQEYQNNCDLSRRNSAGIDIKSGNQQKSLAFMRTLNDDPHDNCDVNPEHLNSDLPLVNKNLSEAVLDIIRGSDHSTVALIVILKSNNLYHINVSLTHTGQSLGDIYTTESALKQAEQQHLFDHFLTFFVLNSENTLEQKNRILGHSFELIHMGD